MPIIGPFTKEDWNTMLLLREDISFMKRKDASKFEVAISKETAMLKDMYRREAA